MLKTFKITTIITWSIALLFITIYIGNATSEMFSSLHNMIDGMLVRGGNSNLTAEYIIDNTILLLSLSLLVTSFILTVVTFHLYSVRLHEARASLKHVKVTNGAKTMDLKALKKANKNKIREEAKAERIKTIEAKKREKAKKKAEAAALKAEAARLAAQAAGVEDEINKIDNEIKETPTVEELAKQARAQRATTNSDTNTTQQRNNKINKSNYLDTLNSK